MSINKEIPELIREGVITQETADKIQAYYATKESSSSNRLFIAFGILGAILVGLGIILIVAHNWDELSRLTKTVLAFLPLLIGQGICGYALIKKKESIAWKESGTAFLFFSVGACIALVSQIYNIPGNLSSFLLTWMLLCLPLVYVMKSSIASLFYIVGITYYAVETGYWTYPKQEPYLYWILLILVLPHYHFLLKKNVKSNFMTFHHWVIPLSVIISLGTLVKNLEEFMFIAYCSAFGLIYMIGNLAFFNQQKSWNNGYKIIGSLGTVVLLLILSFKWFWENLSEQYFLRHQVMAAPEFYAALILSLIALGFLLFELKKKTLTEIAPLSYVFIFFLIAFLIGIYTSFSVVLINLMVFAVGVLTIRNGAKSDHLGILNFGLLIITALVICRFFDANLSFVLRGILFVLVGIGFFLTNYWMLKKRRTNE